LVNKFVRRACALYANDLVASQQTSVRRQIWTLDANLRFRTSSVETATAGGGWAAQRSSRNHHDDSDNPSHITDTTTDPDGRTSAVITRWGRHGTRRGG